MASRRQTNEVNGFVNERNRRKHRQVANPEDVEQMKAVTNERPLLGPPPAPMPKTHHHRGRTSDDENKDPAAAGETSGNHSSGGGDFAETSGGKRNNCNENFGDNNRANEIDMLEQYSQLNENREKECVIYFAISNNQNEATCSSRLSMAYQVCSEHNLAVQWITEEECLTKLPKKENIFVLDPFEGPVYDHLTKHFYKGAGCRIIGPQCIRQAFERFRQHQKWEIPNRGHPMFTLGMSNVIITMTGFREGDGQKGHLANLIQKMSGYYSRTFTKAVTQLLAKSVLSDKCILAYKVGIPVMKADWVEAAWKESLNDHLRATDSHFLLRYVCPIFYNVHFCFSQIDGSRRSTLKKIIESNGGIYSPQLLKNQTQVLIIDHGSGEKFRYAKSWGVLCIRPEWITDCKREGHVIDTRAYEVRLVEDAKDLVSTQNDSRMNVPLADMSVSAIIPTDADVTHCSESRFTNTFRSQANVSQRTEASPPPPSASTSAKPKSKVSKALSDAFEKILEDIIAQGRENQFLDGCKIYLSGTNLPIYQQIKRLLNACGATRFDRLNDSLSHIVVLGSNLTENEIKVLKTYSDKPHIVNLDWIVASSQLKALADEEEFMVLYEKKEKCKLRTSNSKLPDPLMFQDHFDEPEFSEDNHVMPDPVPIIPVDMEEVPDPDPAPIRRVDVEDVPDAPIMPVLPAVEIEEVPPENGEEPIEVGEFEDNDDDIFMEEVNNMAEVAEGRFVPDEALNNNRSNSKSKSNSPPNEISLNEPEATLQPPEENQGSKDSSTSETEADDNNGNSHDHDLLPSRSPAPSSQGWTRIFDGCKFDVLLENAEENTLVKGLIADMNGIVNKQNAYIMILPPVYVLGRPKPAPQLRTKFWLQECYELRSPNIQMQYYHTPMKAFTGMSTVMSNIVIAISGYSAFEKHYIAGVATSMGATFQDVFVRKTSAKLLRSTHLICNVIDNEKFRAAKRWNVPVLRHEWILECFKTHSLLDCEPYRTDKIDSKGSILMETPKSKNTAAKGGGRSVLPSTERKGDNCNFPAIPAPIFKTPGERERNAPAIIVEPEQRQQPTEPMAEDKLGNGNYNPNLSNPDVELETEESPLFSNIYSRAASRQLKAAFAQLTSESPGPDYSSLQVKLPRRVSTPEPESFKRCWSTWMEKRNPKRLAAKEAGAESKDVVVADDNQPKTSPIRQNDVQQQQLPKKSVTPPNENVPKSSTLKRASPTDPADDDVFEKPERRQKTTTGHSTRNQPRRVVSKTRKQQDHSAAR